MRVQNGAWLIFAVLTIMPFAVGAGAQPGKAIDSSNSNVTKPGACLGNPVERVIEIIGSAPNSDIQESGFSLRFVLENPVARELVWAHDLTDAMPLSFSPAGWVINAPEKRTVRMYYHVGFDRSGKAVAAALWYTGPVSAPGSRRVGLPNRPERLIPHPTFWNYDFASGSIILVEWHPQLNDGRVAHWPKSAEGPGEKWQMIAGGRPGSLHRIPAARAADGSYASNGWLMADGRSRNGNSWAVVGQTFGIAHEGLNRGEYQGWGSMTVPSMICIADIRLIMETLPENPFVRGKIVPLTNNKAVQQAGVK